jgi:hypothetical protein
VLGDLTKQDLLVVGLRGVDGRPWLGVPQEEDTLAEDFLVRTIGDDKLGGLAELLNLTLLVELVRLLVVDEQVGGALTCHPTLKDLLVLRLLEGISLVLLQLEGGGYEFVHSS